MVNFSQIIQKAKDYASKNPDKVRQSLDKVESAVNSKTGNKYADQINKGSDAIEQQLGVPKEGTQPTGAPTQAPTPEAPKAPDATPPANQ